MRPRDTKRRVFRWPAIVVVVVLLGVGTVACESRVTGQVLVAGDFTASDSSGWLVQSINVGDAGLLPTVNAVESSGVRDTSYWVDRFAALSDARGGFDAVVLSLGMNDVRADDLTTDVADRIATIADAAGEGGDRTVLWATLSEVSPGHEAGAVAFNQALRGVAGTRPNVRVLEFSGEIDAHPDYLAEDGIRWSLAGQKAFADLVAAALETVPLAARVAVVHTAEQSSVAAGGAIAYRATVTNTGSLTLHHVVVSAPGAPGCAGPLQDLAAGASHTVDCTYATTSADVGTHQSTVTVSSDETAPVASNQVDVTVRAPAALISGTVTSDTSGAPIAGVWVTALRPADFSVAGGGVTSATGDYSIPLGAGSYVLYTIDPSASHRDALYGAPTVVEVAAGTTTDADPVLASRHGSITGTVTEAGASTPLGGMWAMALAGSGATGELEQLAVTDESGAFSLPGLQVGAHFVGYVDPTGAHAPRFHPNSPNVPAAGLVGVTAGGASRADASLPAQTTVGGDEEITGTVTEQGSGLPLPDARVVALRASDFAMVRGAATDESGHYRLELAPGTYKLAIFDATGRHRMEWYDDRPSTGLADAADVTAPGVADASLVATTGTVAGTISDDSSGAPVEGAWVVAIGATGIAGGAVSDGGGDYAIDDLAPGTYRIAFLDPTGGRQLEYFDDAESYDAATPITVSAAAATPVDADLASPRPNIVVIMTDDQTLESMRVMPRVQELLADQGTTFASAFATFPLCCPSRATMLSGQYAHNHGVVNNVAVTSAPNAPRGGAGALDHTNTLATWLDAGGYQTAHVGKYLNCWGNDTSPCRAGEPSVPPGWDDWFGLIDPFPAAYGYFEFDVLDNTQIRHIGPGVDIYQTDVLADRAVAGVARMAGTDQPFFLNIWPQAPHAGVGSTRPNSSSPAPDPQHLSLFTDEPAPSTPAVGESDVSDKPSYIRCGIGLTPGAPAAPGCGAAPTSTWTPSGIAATYRATLQSLQSVDEMVSRVVRALEDTGELDNTVIVYTSDNGFLFGEHRLNFRKVVPYEESVHVPLIIRGPGFPAGQVARQIVGNIDLAPTITGLAGVTAGRVMDGRSLVPLANDPTVATQRAILLEDWPNGAFLGIPPHYDGIRTQTDVYLEYTNGEREYYDLVNDPYQSTSRHGDPATAARRAALASRLTQLKTCVGAACEVTAPP